MQFSRGAGAIYHYPGVTPDEFAAFQKAESLGTHFGKHFRSRAFQKFHPDTKS